MKKELFSYSILSIVIALLLFFEIGLWNEEEQNATRVVKVEAFEKLDIDLECDIYVSLGEEQKIVFEGPEQYVSRVQTTLENGVLKISCEPPGSIARFFNKATEDSGSLKIYVKLTSTGQLLRPKKGNLISNEAFRFADERMSGLLSLNANLATLMKLFAHQFGHISFS